jgi:hypothetical protein
MYVKMYIAAVLSGKRKKEMEKRRGRQPEAMSVAVDPSSVPRTGVEDQCFLSALQNETSHRKDLPSLLQELGNVLDGPHAQVSYGIGNPHNQLQ